MSTLVVTTRPIECGANGYDLRVANLCRGLVDEQHLVVVPIEDEAPDAPLPCTIDAGGIFTGITRIDRGALQRPRPLRHLRLSEEHFLHRAQPRFFDAALSTLRCVRQRTGAERMIVFGAPLAGLARAAGMRRVLFDVCDSMHLRLRRGREHEPVPSGVLGRWRQALGLLRWRGCEGVLPHAFAHVTAVNEADAEEIRRCAGRAPANVHTVPNGVGDAFLARSGVASGARRRGVAFWGNLDFAPNRVAARYLVEQVWRPHLRDKGFELCLIGRGAEPWLVEAAACDGRLRLLGYVDDLAAEIRCWPVLANPMWVGSGMKNKVLEAFAGGVAVVSTPLGMEAIAGAVAGTHHLLADAPLAFARAIERLCDDAALRRRLGDNAARLVAERYTWAAVGRRWRELHESLA